MLIVSSSFFLQERTRSFDGFSMHSLENSLIDIMRAEQDSLKGLFPPKQFHSNMFFSPPALLAGEVQHFSLYKMRTRVVLFFFYNVDLCRSQQGLGQRSVVRQLIYNVMFSVSKVILNQTELKLGLQHSHVQMYASLCNFSDKVIRVLQSEYYLLHILPADNSMASIFRNKPTTNVNILHCMCVAYSCRAGAASLV